MVGIGLSSAHRVCESTVRQIVCDSHEGDINCRGDYIRPEWFALHSSRGLETSGIKSFMRFSVIISDCALFVPALLAYSQFVVPMGRKVDKVYFPLFKLLT